MRDDDPRPVWMSPLITGVNQNISFLPAIFST